MILINAKIYTMTSDKPIDKGYVKINGKTIVSVGKMSDAEQSTDEKVIDLKGARVYPGFIDAHTHLGIYEDGLTFEGDDLNETTEPVTPNLRAIDAANPMDRCFAEAIAAGVTTVLISPGSTNPIAGQIAAIKTAGRRIDDMIIKAPVGIKMSMGENPKGNYSEKEQSPVTRMAVAALIRETLAKARRYAKDKQDALKNPDEHTLPDYDSKLEALVPLIKGEIKPYFHAHRADDIFTAIRIANEFKLKPVIIHGTEGHLIAQELAQENVPVLSGPFMCDRPKPELSNQTPASPGIMTKNGVKTAIVTDHNVIPIQYLPICAALAVKHGMSEYDALKAITVNPAEICGISDRVGTIEAGKDADIVIMDKSPLDFTAAPSMVFISGKRVL